MIRLQLALDVVELPRALEIAAAASPYVDIIEAGTPLIKQYGMRAVRQLHARFPDKPVFADMKTADAGDLEVSIAARAGAQFVSVLAAAPIETMISAVDEARRRGGISVVADLLGVANVREAARQLAELNVDYLLAHCGIDEQKVGRDPFPAVLLLAEEGFPKLALAGGIGLGSLERVLAVPRLSILIVGNAITGAKDPAAAALAIRNRIEKIEHGYSHDKRAS